ncbi:hypothetical protein E2C01_047274 [Portunus trituberculatus]|uniref:Uncharacterized protein n=1 Tax=Portunus trituberculatus TaxID=210409 RepID=A0A5B7G7I7_PORTR|nr:hypothetical protein [Portunus trituberculatus]
MISRNEVKEPALLLGSACFCTTMTFLSARDRLADVSVRLALPRLASPCLALNSLPPSLHTCAAAGQKLDPAKGH